MVLLLNHCFHEHIYRSAMVTHVGNCGHDHERLVLHKMKQDTWGSHYILAHTDLKKYAV